MEGAPQILRTRSSKTRPVRTTRVRATRCRCNAPVIRRPRAGGGDAATWRAAPTVGGSDHRGPHR